MIDKIIDIIFFRIQGNLQGEDNSYNDVERRDGDHEGPPVPDDVSNSRLEKQPQAPEEFYDDPRNSSLSWPNKLHAW